MPLKNTAVEVCMGGFVTSAHALRVLSVAHNMPLVADLLCIDPNSRPICLQLGVLEWFARLWEIAKDDYWVCINGSFGQNSSTLTPNITCSNNSINEK